MRTALSRVMIAIAGLACAYAQNSDLGFMTGVSLPTTEVVVGPNTRVSASVGGSGQINYAWQVLATRAGDLYVELPFVVTGHASSSNATSPITVESGGVFLIPGIRFKLPLQSRVSLYGATGIGPGWFGETVIRPGTVEISTHTTTAVFDFGGGLDLRLSKLVSLRGEIRDFVRLSGSVGRNHSMIQFGVGLHF